MLSVRLRLIGMIRLNPQHAVRAQEPHRVFLHVRTRNMMSSYNIDVVE